MEVSSSVWLWFPARNISAVVERQEKMNDSKFSHVVCDGCGSRGEGRPGWLGMGLNLLSQGDKRADEREQTPAGPPHLEDLTRSDQI